MSVDFVLKGNIDETQYVLLCKTRSGEWKVCGLRPGGEKMLKSPGKTLEKH